MCTPDLESKFQSDKQNWFVYVFSYSVPNFNPNFIQNSTRRKIYRNVLGVRSNFCSVLYIDSYFLSLIQKWLMYMYLQVRKFADRSLIYRLQICFYLDLRPF